jgi:hypothetical protein
MFAHLKTLAMSIKKQSDHDKRDSLIFYRSFYESIKQIPDEKEQLKVYNSIFEYSLNFNEIELSGIASSIFTIIKPLLSANNKRYQNGSKPKAKRKQNGSKPEANKNDNDNVNDNVNVNVNVNDFLNVFKKVSGKSRIKVIDKKTQQQLKILLQAYTMQDIELAIKNAMADSYHIESKFKYITPEFITRPDKFQKFVSINIDTKPVIKETASREW